MTSGNAVENDLFYITLSDLFVLLCVFFLMFVSISEIDMGTFERFRTELTGETGGTLVELADRCDAVVHGSPGVPGVTVELAPEGVRLDLDAAVLFDVGSAALKPGALEPMGPVLDELVDLPYHVDVEGHSDDRPLYRWQGDELVTNWSLSGRRASAVLNHLAELGIPRDRLRIIGYAHTRPRVSPQGKVGADLEEARSENRRVSLLVR